VKMMGHIFWCVFEMVSIASGVLLFVRTEGSQFPGTARASEDHISQRRIGVKLSPCGGAPIGSYAD